jgi:hypothetical protein
MTCSTFREQTTFVACFCQVLPRVSLCIEETAMRHPGRFGIVFLVLFSAALARPAKNSPLPLVMANDNQTPAGQLKKGVLELRLELSQGRWYPGDEEDGYGDVYAFAEEGHAPQSSGPLIRVPLGTGGGFQRWALWSVILLTLPQFRRPMLSCCRFPCCSGSSR